MEAVLNTSAGGSLGILAGVLGAFLLATTALTPVDVTFGEVATAAGFSIATGIVLGYFPARKASMLEPSPGRPKPALGSYSEMGESERDVVVREAFVTAHGRSRRR